MTIPRFIQISALTSFPASLLNRDDSGLAKRIRFGGAIRTRISSQCIKRHWRTADDAYSLDNIDEALQTSLRSREIFAQKVLPSLLERGYDQAAATEVLGQFIEQLYGKLDKDNPLSRKEVVVLGWPEIEFLVNAAAALLDGVEADAAGDDAKRLKGAKEAAKGYLKNREVKKNWKALRCGAGIDAAMFGRFVSGDPEARVDAAIHVAHPFTVHAEASETDYFTAVDDLTTRTEGGSGHLGAAELTSGLYYTYVVVDVPQLVSNLNGVPAGQWLETDRALAARTVKHLIHLLATVSPGAKLGSTAPYSYAGLVLAEAGERQPRTLADAFLAPVEQSGDMFGESVARVGAHLAALDGMYGCEEQRWIAARTDLAGLPVFGAMDRVTLSGLAEAVEATILKGE